MLMFAWLFGVILWSAFAVVRHAEALGEILGEPFGTLILTFAITAIEVMMIAAVMLTGPAVSTLARDTMFAVIMIVFNGIPGGNHSPRRAGAGSPGFPLVSGSDAIAAAPDLP